MKIIPKTLSGKLKAYSLFAGSITAFTSAQGQIIYTDIDPDQHFDPGFPYYFMDLTGDGNFDFYLYGNHAQVLLTDYSGAWYKTMDSVRIVLYNGNSIGGMATISSYNQIPFAYNEGEHIFYDIADWNTAGNLFLAYDYYYIYVLETPEIINSFSFGNFVNGAEDKYLALRSRIDGDSYYGWLRLDVDSTNNSFTVKDYAYNTTPNEGIYAGELVSNIQESISDYEIYYACPEIHFILPIENQNLNIEILNLSGEIIYSKNLTTNRIDVSDFIPGIYFVKLIDENKIIVVKEIVVL